MTISEDCSEPTLWRRGEWTAKVVRNEEDHGWAVEMYRAGDNEPALVGPWTMGRDKKNPKPLDQGAFTTLVKTANDVLSRHAQSQKDALRQKRSFTLADGSPVRAELAVVPDEDDPHGLLRCVHELDGQILREGKVGAGFRLTLERVERFIATGDGGA